MNLKRNPLIVAVIALFGLLILSCRQAYTRGQAEENPPANVGNAPVSQTSPPPRLEEIQYSFRQVAQSVLPVVVEINVVEVVSQTAPRFRSPWDFFFGPSPGDDNSEEREFRRGGLGSGVLVRRQGDRIYVLTNNHVVGEADEISVRLHDEREFKARLVGTDPRRDLALVVFDSREDIPIARLGDSDTLQVGDLVLAVGNPFGFESTVTSGIISALGRKAETGSTIASFTDYIQTDAAINPGNSGGALVNLKGDVIGLNTWIASRTGSYMGLGFAVPINNAKKAIDDFITKGRVEYGWLGVQIGNLDLQIYPEAKEKLGLKDLSGAFVFNIFKGAPADKAGIIPGDYIIEVNNEAVRDADHLTHIVGNLPPGDESQFEIIRSRSRMTIKIKISIRKEEKEITSQSKNLWPGMYVGELTDDLIKQLKLPEKISGILIQYVIDGTPAAIAGFRQGDVIKKINDTEAKNVADFYRAINSSKTKEVMMRLFREESEIILELIR